MDIPFPSSSHSLLIAAGAIAMCCLCAAWAFQEPRSKKKKKKNHCGVSCPRSCGRGADTDTVVGDDKAATSAERQAGASMMEQLVPEITMHALSYLDYTSLCRLSMTNTAMRRAANDDGAWKALYHKDFTVEQDTIDPSRGWKAYYAATKAIVNLNAEFFNIIRKRSFPAMSRLWLDADYVKCVHRFCQLFTGYYAVMNSWDMIMAWDQGLDYRTRDVRARILGDTAWVSMDADTHINANLRTFHVINVYEFHNGRWYMVCHHTSVKHVAVDWP